MACRFSIKIHENDIPSAADVLRRCTTHICSVYYLQGSQYWNEPILDASKCFGSFLLCKIKIYFIIFTNIFASIMFRSLLNFRFFSSFALSVGCRFHLALRRMRRKKKKNDKKKIMEKCLTDMLKLILCRQYDNRWKRCDLNDAWSFTKKNLLWTVARKNIHSDTRLRILIFYRYFFKLKLIQRWFFCWFFFLLIWFHSSGSCLCERKVNRASTQIFLILEFTSEYVIMRRCGNNKDYMNSLERNGDKNILFNNWSESVSILVLSLKERNVDQSKIKTI